MLALLAAVKQKSTSNNIRELWLIWTNYASKTGAQTMGTRHAEPDTEEESRTTLRMVCQSVPDTQHARLTQCHLVDNIATTRWHWHSNTSSTSVPSGGYMSRWCIVKTTWCELVYYVRYLWYRHNVYVSSDCVVYGMVLPAAHCNCKYCKPYADYPYQSLLQS
jgi:hypothetical protein